MLEFNWHSIFTSWQFLVWITFSAISDNLYFQTYPGPLCQVLQGCDLRILLYALLGFCQFWHHSAPSPYHQHQLYRVLVTNNITEKINTFIPLPLVFARLFAAKGNLPILYSTPSSFNISSDLPTHPTSCEIFII